MDPVLIAVFTLGALSNIYTYLAVSSQECTGTLAGLLIFGGFSTLFKHWDVWSFAVLGQIPRFSSQELNGSVRRRTNCSVFQCFYFNLQ